MTAGAVTTTFLAAPSLPAGGPRLVLTGFMGTGKSTAGREAAALLGMTFVDLDRLIEARERRSIREIFAADGEPGFRLLERTALADAARLSSTVVATGGGAVMQVEAFDDLARGAEVVVLTADPEVISRRIGGSGAGRGRRPMLAGEEVEARILRLSAERAERYAAVGAPLDTSSAIRGVAGPEAAERYRRRAGDVPRVRIDVPGPGDAPYPVVLGRGALARLPAELCDALPSCTTVAVAAEPAASEAAGVSVVAALRDAGLRVVPVRVSGGEAGKTVDAVVALWEAFREARLSRSDAVVAVGGGATLDAVGFAAATYARGVPLVNVPTTLLAMVDASLGGKVAIDHADVKNLVGSFHHPSLVVADPGTLETLPPSLVRHGLAEAVKEAVLASPAMLDVLGSEPLDDDGLPRHLDWVVEQAVRIKAAYVGSDPFDRDVRHSLNLGHTFAHAIESASGYGVAHGDAVAMGTVAAARLGERLGVTPAGSAERLSDLSVKLGLPDAVPPGTDRDAMIAAIGSDKKRRGERTVFVVPAPGGAVLVEGLDPGEALAALDVGGVAT
jgi:shikimate kinase/3-dehydroquinate synthase